MATAKSSPRSFDVLKGLGYTPRVVGDGNVGVDLGKALGTESKLFLSPHAPHIAEVLRGSGAIVLHAVTDIVPNEPFSYTDGSRIRQSYCEPSPVSRPSEGMMPHVDRWKCQMRPC